MVKITLSGGSKLEEQLRRMSRNLDTAASVDVGFMGGATYEDGTPVAAVAAFNEYGVPSHGQPPRPFFRRAIRSDSKQWAHNLATALVQKEYNAAAALELTGIDVKESIEQSIRELTSPPLAKSTIHQKGFAKPLIDTGTMLRSVTSKVNKD